MQDLRLVGVHDDSEHLLLSGVGGEIYRLRIDEALRVASTRMPARQSAQVKNDPAAGRLSPKDIQQRIRGGASAEEVAEAAGVPLEHVQRYEGPVLAEREHIALQARRVEVSDAVPSHDGYRSAFGDDPASLDEMVSHRLTAMGIDASTVVWDAWRRPDGQWAVTANFDGTDAKVSGVGESAPAQWIYSVSRKSIQNTNRWAQLLSEIEPLDSPLPPRRLAAVADRPFDFETDRPEGDTAESVETAAEAGSGPVDAAQTETEHPETAHPETAEQSPAQSVGGQNTGSQNTGPQNTGPQNTGPRNTEPQNTEQGSDSLLELLRSRRGQRLGVDEEDDDALAAMLTEGVPAAHPREEDSPSSEQEPEADSAKAEQPSFFPALSLAPSPSPDPVDRPAEENDFSGTVRPDPLELSDGVSTQTREIRISAAPLIRSADSGTKTGKDPAMQESKEPAPDENAANERRPTVKPKRSSVPSWDEIVFGTKGD